MSRMLRRNLPPTPSVRILRLPGIIASHLPVATGLCLIGAAASVARRFWDGERCLRPQLARQISLPGLERVPPCSADFREIQSQSCCTSSAQGGSQECGVCLAF